MKTLSGMVMIFIIGGILCLGALFAVWLVGAAPDLWSGLTNMVGTSGKRYLGAGILIAVILLGTADERGML